MDRATLDLAYNNSKAVPESAAMFRDWSRRASGCARDIRTISIARTDAMLGVR